MNEVNKQLIEQEVQKHQVAIAAQGWNIEEITSAVIVLCEAFEIIAIKIDEIFRPIAQWFDEYGTESEQFYTERSNRESYKLDFTKPLIQHQVLDRKPKHLIKKVL